MLLNELTLEELVNDIISYLNDDTIFSQLLSLLCTTNYNYISKTQLEYIESLCRYKAYLRYY